LSSGEFRDALKTHLANSSHSVLILSAFIKVEALKWMIAESGSGNISVVARWLPGELLTGASDLECYEICRDKGIPFGISLTLHGKVYCADGHILVGSANVTSKGLALAEKHNDEFGYKFEAGTADLNKLNSYLDSVVWLNDEIFSRIQYEVGRLEGSEDKETAAWPEGLLAPAQDAPEFLWVHELLFTLPDELIERQHSSSSDIVHDRDLLGLSQGDITLSSAIHQFQRSKSCIWLSQLLATHGSVSFGNLSSILHDSLMDDPTPYRREVKHIVSILFAWAEKCDVVFSVTQSRYSQVISLVDAPC